MPTVLASLHRISPSLPWIHLACPCACVRARVLVCTRQHYGAFSNGNGPRIQNTTRAPCAHAYTTPHTRHPHTSSTTVLQRQRCRGRSSGVLLGSTQRHVTRQIGALLFPCRPTRRYLPAPRRARARGHRGDALTEDSVAAFGGRGRGASGGRVALSVCDR